MPYTERHMARTKERLEDLRKEKKLSYEQLSKLLEERGTPISHTNLKNYEIGDPEHRLYSRTRGMSIENLVALADAFDVSVDYLLGRSKSRKAEYHQMSEELRLSDDAIDTMKAMIDEDRKESVGPLWQRVSIVDEFLTDGDMLTALDFIRKAANAHGIAQAYNKERIVDEMFDDEELKKAKKYLRRYGLQAVDSNTICDLYITDALSLIDGVVRKLPARLDEGYREWLVAVANAEPRREPAGEE